MAGTDPDNWNLASDDLGDPTALDATVSWDEDLDPPQATTIAVSASCAEQPATAHTGTTAGSTVPFSWQVIADAAVAGFGAPTSVVESAALFGRADVTTVGAPLVFGGDVATSLAAVPAPAQAPTRPAAASALITVPPLRSVTRRARRGATASRQTTAAAGGGTTDVCLRRDDATSAPPTVPRNARPTRALPPSDLPSLHTLSLSVPVVPFASSRAGGGDGRDQQGDVFPQPGPLTVHGSVHGPINPSDSRAIATATAASAVAVPTSVASTHFEQETTAARASGGSASAAVDGRAADPVLRRGADGVFHCPYCSCTQKSSNNMQRHMRLHTGARPYVCHHPGCSYSSARGDDLEKHQVRGVLSARFCVIVGGCQPGCPVLT